VVDCGPLKSVKILPSIIFVLFEILQRGSYGLLASRTLIDYSAGGGVPPGGLWLPILVEHSLDLTRVHSGVGSRYLDHRNPVIINAPLS
jgi:hypothetical protein